MAEQGPHARPDLWREVLRRGLQPPAGANGFRAAVASASCAASSRSSHAARPGRRRAPRSSTRNDRRPTAASCAPTTTRRASRGTTPTTTAAANASQRLGRADREHGLTREEAEELLHELVAAPSPHDLYSERLTACLNLLKSVVGIQTVRLAPSVYHVFAAQGYGEEIVARAMSLLVDAGLAEVSYEVSGINRVACVRAA